MDFYEELSATYDRMTRFESRLEKEMAILRLWVDRYSIKSVLDVACGTGLHVIALRKLGVDATGVDLSDSMIQKARANSRANSVEARFITSSMTNLRDTIRNEFDAVLCLGNSIPHLLNKRDLIGALGSFASVLKPDGLLLLQLLNYKRILASGNRIVGIHSDGDLEFVRFYDFLDTFVRFNILEIDHSGESISHRLHSTKLYPYSSDELIEALSETTFRDVELFGSMNRNVFDSSDSTDLVISARNSHTRV